MRAFVAAVCTLCFASSAYADDNSTLEYLGLKTKEIMDIIKLGVYRKHEIRDGDMRIYVNHTDPNVAQKLADLTCAISKKLPWTEKHVVEFYLAGAVHPDGQCEIEE